MEKLNSFLNSNKSFSLHLTATIRKTTPLSFVDFANLSKEEASFLQIGHQSLIKVKIIILPFASLNDIVPSF
ncbi:MAG: hypothetical protein OEW45_20850, partial [Deltaproteobacteria bacterium]|nr:hypothetical protein [Deltaproteobacteria bacterium]